jgi:HK97 family phage prohead protease
MSNSTRPPREDLIRAASPEVEQIELRAASEAGGPVMAGHFAVFNQWTEINSMWEGNFMERFAPGAFKKTFKDSRDRMRVLFQHGQDPQVGDKPLGPISELGEDERGAAYEVPLLDASYVRDQVLPGLQAGLYGASFRFKVMREEIVDEPPTSEHNPHGLPERTVKEAQVMEFGPVTFPAYEGATAGVRSMTDEFLMRCLQRDPDRLREMFEQATELQDEEVHEEQETLEEEVDAPSTPDAALTRTSEPERREPQDPPAPADKATRKAASNYLKSRKDRPSWAIPH